MVPATDKSHAPPTALPPAAIAPSHSHNNYERLSHSTALQQTRTCQPVRCMRLPVTGRLGPARRVPRLHRTAWSRLASHARHSSLWDGKGLLRSRRMHANRREVAWREIQAADRPSGDESQAWMGCARAGACVTYLGGWNCQRRPTGGQSASCPGRPPRPASRLPRKRFGWPVRLSRSSALRSVSGTRRRNRTSWSCCPGAASSDYWSIIESVCPAARLSSSPASPSRSGPRLRPRRRPPATGGRTCPRWARPW